MQYHAVMFAIAEEELHHDNRIYDQLLCEMKKVDFDSIRTVDRGAKQM